MSAIDRLFTDPASPAAWRGARRGPGPTPDGAMVSEYESYTSRSRPRWRGTEIQIMCGIVGQFIIGMVPRLCGGAGADGLVAGPSWSGWSGRITPDLSAWRTGACDHRSVRGGTRADVVRTVPAGLLSTERSTTFRSFATLWRPRDIGPDSDRHRGILAAYGHMEWIVANIDGMSAFAIWAAVRSG